MRILFEWVGNSFQIPMASFHPYVVGGPEANRKALVTDRNKFLWHNTDPVSDLLHQGVLVTDARAHLLALFKISRWKSAVRHLWYLAGIDALAGTHGIRLELVWVEKVFKNERRVIAAGMLTLLGILILTGARIELAIICLTNTALLWWTYRKDEREDENGSKQESI